MSICASGYLQNPKRFMLAGCVVSVVSLVRPQCEKWLAKVSIQECEGMVVFTDLEARETSVG